MLIKIEPLKLLSKLLKMGFTQELIYLFFDEYQAIWAVGETHQLNTPQSPWTNTHITLIFLGTFTGRD